MGQFRVDNKKIAKNTLLLYIRTLAILAVSLYTSRIILQELGVEDYGIYNLVAGFITFFAFISNALTSALQRFFNISLGKQDFNKYQQIYTASIDIMSMLGVAIICIGEILGPWFINHYLNIPQDRLFAANWVYQLSLITFFINLIRVSFNASIIAHEQMRFYSYVGILDALLRLLIVFMIPILGGDKLIIYSILYFLITLILFIIYGIYTHRSFKECIYSHKNINTGIYKEVMSFSSWTLVGQGAVCLRTQGESILINRYFSVIANAAMGIANQVTAAVDIFVVNFQTAFNPQIVKSFASESKHEHYKLIYRASKMSFYLLLIISAPLISNIDKILSIWLKTVPMYSDKFIIYILLSHLINVIGNPLYVSIMASGKIKEYQIGFSHIFILGLIMSYIFLNAGAEPYVIAKISFFVQFLLLIFRIYISHKVSGISIRQFSIMTLWPIIRVVSLSLIVVSVVNITINGFVLNIVANISSLLLIIFIIGIDQLERSYITSQLKRLNLLKKQ